MAEGNFRVPTPVNEPVLSYNPNTNERTALKAKLNEMLNTPPFEIPLIIGGKEVKTNKLADIVMPTNHSKVLARYHKS